MTFLSPLLFVGIGAFVGYLSSMKADMKTIAIHDETGKFVSQFKSDEEYKYLDLSSVDTKILKDSIVKESYEGLLIIPKAANNESLQKGIQYVSNDSPSVMFVEKLEDVISKKITDENFLAQGLDTLKISKAKADVSINLTKASGEESLKGLNEIKIGIGGAFGYLIVMFIIIYGNMVMRSVIEEKTSRIIEVIISSVKPFQLMMGKIIGPAMISSRAWAACIALWAGTAPCSPTPAAFRSSRCKICAKSTTTASRFDRTSTGAFTASRQRKSFPSKRTWARTS